MGRKFLPTELHNYIHPRVIVLTYILWLIIAHCEFVFIVCAVLNYKKGYTLYLPSSPPPPYLPSPHLPMFPVVLVLGVATSMTAIHRTLPRSASSLLSIEQLHTQHSTLTLSHIIEEVNAQQSQVKRNNTVVKKTLNELYSPY